MAAGFFGKTKRTGGLITAAVAGLGIPLIAKGISGLAKWGASKLRG